MGLRDVDSQNSEEEIEIKKLETIGISIKDRNDSDINGYFYDKGLSGKRSTSKIIDEAKKGVLSIVTEGFIDGELQHNMPCPVCLNEQAKYINNRKEHFFAPCGKCSAKGYVLKRHWWGL